MVFQANDIYIYIYMKKNGDEKNRKNQKIQFEKVTTNERTIKSKDDK